VSGPFVVAVVALDEIAEKIGKDGEPERPDTCALANLPAISATSGPWLALTALKMAAVARPLALGLLRSAETASRNVVRVALVQQPVPLLVPELFAEFLLGTLAAVVAWQVHAVGLMVRRDDQAEHIAT
jgi:hypothetical protein